MKSQETGPEGSLVCVHVACIFFIDWPPCRTDQLVNLILPICHSPTVIFLLHLLLYNNTTTALLRNHPGQGELADQSSRGPLGQHTDDVGSAPHRWKSAQWAHPEKCKEAMQKQTLVTFII